MSAAEDQKKPSPWKSWYDKGGKDKIAENRKKKYQDDPEYRAKVIRNSVQYRKKRREKESGPPPEYNYSYQEAADEIGVSVTVLHHWRLKRWMPSPFKHKGRVLFTQTQVELLSKLAEFLKNRSRAHTARDLKDLEDLVSEILVNWS